jgi:multidrug efflux pump subunit AcrA (membrane-fusion protein)
VAEADFNLASIGTLLQIEADVRACDSERALEFVCVNDTFRLLPYRQAVLWRHVAGQPVFRQVSGLADVAADSPYRQWLNKALAHLQPKLDGRTHLLATVRSLPRGLRSGWVEWMAPHALLLPLPAPSGTSAGILWLALERAPEDSELALVERLASAYGHGLWAWRREWPVWRVALTKLLGRRNRLLLAGVLAAVSLLPLRLAVQAPFEIAGKDARLIGAPFDGVVGSFHVQPNQLVARDAPLFSLDDTSARNRNEVAGKSRAIAEAELLRATQKSFEDGSSRGDLSALKARLEEKAAEAQYTKDLFERVLVKAPEAGIVVFSDPNDWLGRPVQTGERIMLLATPGKVEVAINLPVDEAIDLQRGDKARLYLNVAPLKPLDATVTQVSYEPALADGVVAYRVRAEIDRGQELPRIGLRGSARLYGQRAPLLYHAVRKPLEVLRRTVGF